MTEKLVKDHFIRMIITPFAPFIPYSEPSFLISTSRMSSTDTALLASSNEIIFGSAYNEKRFGTESKR